MNFGQNLVSKVMMGKKMPFLKILRGHTQYWKGDANFISPFSRFEKMHLYILANLKSCMPYPYLTERIRKLHNISPIKLIYEICVALQIMGMTT